MDYERNDMRSRNGVSSIKMVSYKAGASLEWVGGEGGGKSPIITALVGESRLSKARTDK